MTTTVLTTQALDELLLAFLQRLEGSFFSAAGVVFRTLYNHGFRIQELANCHNWSITQDGFVIAPTSKRGDPRTLLVSDLHDLFIQSILHGKNYVYRSHYRTYDSYFQSMKGCVSLAAGGKELSTHAFRHNVIKKMWAQGKTTQEIATTMGIRQLPTVEQYIYSTIKATYL